ncbi:MAG: hypothetical protein AMS18_11515 [Gemmatimonas sp. SG8_17]|nr:MAG: hypothetical protein AMS18_11515 [Gemmatimonas sp. SG8_17]
MRTAAIILVGSLGAAPLTAQSDSIAAGHWASLFAKETLVYEAKFGFITLGSGMMHTAGVDTVHGTPALHVIFVLRGGGVIYSLHDRMDSWIGLDDFASRRFVQDLHEGGNEYYRVFDIFPDSGYYVQQGVDSVLPTVADPLDDYAFFYFVRTLELVPGDTLEFNNYFRPDRNPVILEVLERDTLDLPAGRFPTIVTHPVIQGRGILAEGKEARMWISDDERRLMVQLKVKFSFATITLRLKSIVDEPPPDMLIRPGVDPDS